MALIVCSRGFFFEIDRQGGREGGRDGMRGSFRYSTVLARAFVEGEGGRAFIGGEERRGERGVGSTAFYGSLEDL